MSGLLEKCLVLPTEENRNMQISELQESYNFLKVTTLAHSRCGRRITALSIGNEAEQVLLCGGVHGMEYITTMLLMRYAETLLNSLQRGTEICDIRMSRFLKRRGLIIIPCLNPDGTEISLKGAKTAGRYQKLVENVSRGNTKYWQANAAGVDINHNFDAGWRRLKVKEKRAGINFPAPTRYGGEYPESEPETRAITTLCRNKNIRHAIAFHSQGEEIYSEYGLHTPNRSKIMAEIMAESSGYKISTPEDMATGGGFKDWFIEEFHRPGFTIEIGKGKNPLPLENFEEIYKNLEEMLSLCVIM